MKVKNKLGIIRILRKWSIEKSSVLIDWRVKRIETKNDNMWYKPC